MDLRQVKLQMFKLLSAANKMLLPKIYKKPDLSKLTKIDMAVAGYKRWVTFNYFDARDAIKK